LQARSRARDRLVTETHGGAMISSLKDSHRLTRTLLVITLLTALVATFGLGCGKKDDKDSGTTVSTPTAAEPAAPATSPSSGQSMTVVVPTTPTESVEGETAGGDGEGTVTGADEGLPTVVYERDEVGPCIEGMQEVTHYTEYSNGTAASSVSMQPCGDVSPVEE
jgi:hypothetical protein